MSGRKLSLNSVLLGIMLALGAITSTLLVINYTDTIFLVILGWIIVPVIIAKLYYGLKKGRSPLC
jgi:hypothetical protein